jgi:hypothetical protein
MKEESPLLGGSGNGGGTSTLVLGVSSIPSTPASMKACNIAKPKMGDVLQSNPPNGVWVPWTGGKPLADWYSLEPSAMMAAHCRRTMHHFVLCGLDTITYLPDPSWCKKCNCWTTSHGTEQHCAKGDGTSTPSKVNLPLVKIFAT